MSANERVNILLVDDQPARLLTYQSVLSELGQNLVCAHSGLEALDKLMREEFAVVLLDVSMPGMDGFEAARLIHDHPRFEKTPIIFVTGHGDIPMSVRAMKAGAVEFLTKPYREQDLLEAIQHGIRQHRTKREQRAEIIELQRRYELLTLREREVFPLVAGGLLNKQVGAQLGASEKTIKVHRGQVMQKMKADSLAELIRMAERLKITSIKA